MRVSDFNGRSNNLNFMKFIGAFLVIYAHAFVITGKTDQIIKLPIDFAVDWGGIAVAFFFFFSGFYVTKSLLVRKKKISFWAARIGRLYPALLAVVVCTAFIVGPIVSEYSADIYFRSKGTYKYLFGAIMLPQYKLPGVFVNNHLQYTVNGSIWSLTLEMICYFGLYGAFCLKLLEKKKLKWINFIFAGAVFLIFGIRSQEIYQFRAYIRPLCTFIVGMEYYIFRENIKIDIFKIAAATFIGGILFKYGLDDLCIILIFPYLISAFAFWKKQLPKYFAVLGEYSYGIYLVAFPVQQILASYLPQMNVSQNTVIALMMSLVVAIPLHHLIEVPCYKKITCFAGKW